MALRDAALALAAAFGGFAFGAWAGRSVGYAAGMADAHEQYAAALRKRRQRRSVARHHASTDIDVGPRKNGEG